MFYIAIFTLFFSFQADAGTTLTKKKLSECGFKTRDTYDAFITKNTFPDLLEEKAIQDICKENKEANSLVKVGVIRTPSGWFSAKPEMRILLRRFLKNRNNAEQDTTPILFLFNEAYFGELYSKNSTQAIAELSSVLKMLGSVSTSVSKIMSIASEHSAAVQIGDDACYDIYSYSFQKLFSESEVSWMSGIWKEAQEKFEKDQAQFSKDDGILYTFFTGSARYPSCVANHHPEFHQTRFYIMPKDGNNGPKVKILER